MDMVSPRSSFQYLRGKFPLAIDWEARRASQLVWNVKGKKSSAPAEYQILDRTACSVVTIPTELFRIAVCQSVTREPLKAEINLLAPKIFFFNFSTSCI